jgi:hypothetical protein
MALEYRVVDQMFGKPEDVEKELNQQARDGWEFVQAITLGPIPTRWLVFKRGVGEAA